MKGIIIYKGKYGATSKYAEWIGERLGLPAMTSSDISGQQLSKYDFFILGSSVYFGKLLLRKWLAQNRSFLQGKHLFLFTVSGTPPDQTQLLQSFILNNVQQDLRTNMDVFFLPGRLNLKSLSFFHYFMLKMGARMEKDPAIKKRMLTEYDDVKKENLLELENAVDKFCKVPV